MDPEQYKLLLKENIKYFWREEKHEKLFDLLYELMSNHTDFFDINLIDLDYIDFNILSELSKKYYCDSILTIMCQHKLVHVALDYALDSRVILDIETILSFFSYIGSDQFDKDYDYTKFESLVNKVKDSNIDLPPYKALANVLLQGDNGKNHADYIIEKFNIKINEETAGLVIKEIADGNLWVDTALEWLEEQGVNFSFLTQCATERESDFYEVDDGWIEAAAAPVEADYDSELDIDMMPTAGLGGDHEPIE